MRQELAIVLASILSVNLHAGTTGNKRPVLDTANIVPFGVAADGYSILRTNNGDIVVCGETQPTMVNKSDLLVAKFSAFGSLIWSKTYDFGGTWEAGQQIIVVPSGGYLIVGGNGSMTNYDTCDGLLVRLNENGDTLWHRTAGGPGWDQFYCATIATDGSIYAGGQTCSYGTLSNGAAWLMRFNSTGDSLWSRTYAAESANSVLGIRAVSSDKIVATGSMADNTNDGLFLMVDSSGGALALKTLGSPDYYDRLYSLSVAPDGSGFAAGGLAIPFNSGGVLWLVRLAPNGDTLWTQTWGGPGFIGIFFGTCFMPDMGVVVVGSRTLDNGLFEVYVARTSADGKSSWTYTWPVPNVSTMATSVVSTSDTSFVVAGIYNTNPTATQPPFLDNLMLLFMHEEDVPAGRALNPPLTADLRGKVMNSVPIFDIMGRRLPESAARSTDGIARVYVQRTITLGNRAGARRTVVSR